MAAPNAPYLLLAAAVSLAAAAASARFGASSPASCDRQPDSSPRTTWQSAWLAPAIVTLVAVVLRVALGVWGPLHVTGQGPWWIRGALGEAKRLEAYGPGFTEVFSLVLHRSPIAADYTLFLINAVLSAAVAPLVYAVARTLEIERRRALAAMILIAVDPITVRYAATEIYFVPIMALTLGATLALVVGARRVMAGSPVSGALFAVAAALACAQATRMQPVAWLPALAAPTAIVAVPGAPARKAWTLAACGVALVATICLIATPTASSLHERVVHPELVDTVLRVFAIGPPLLLVRRWVRSAEHKALVVATAPHLVALTCTLFMYAPSLIIWFFYQRLFLPIPLLAWVANVRAPRRPIVAVAIVLAAMGVVSVRGFTTEMREYTWLREQILRMPAGCAVTSVTRVHRTILAIPDFLHPDWRPDRPVPDVARAEDVLSIQDRAACVYYLHTSLCSTENGAPRCAAVESGLSLIPVAETSLPAFSTRYGAPYLSDTVTVRVYQLERRR